MALIRHAEAQKLARDAVVLDLGDLAAQGDRLIAESRRRAEQIIEDARAERERLISGAHEEGEQRGFEVGHEAGLAAGREQGTADAHEERRTELEAIEEAWSRTLTEIRDQRDRLYDDAVADVIRLSIAVAEKIIRRTIETDPTVCTGIVQETLSLVATGSRVRIRLHPDDRPLVERVLPSIGAGADERDVVLVDDPELSRGSSVATIRSSASEAGGTGGHASIDASIETQLDRIVDALLPGSGRDEERAL